MLLHFKFGSWGQSPRLFALPLIVATFIFSRGREKIIVINKTTCYFSSHHPKKATRDAHSKTYMILSQGK